MDKISHFPKLFNYFLGYSKFHAFLYTCDICPGGLHNTIMDHLVKAYIHQGLSFFHYCCHAFSASLHPPASFLFLLAVEGPQNSILLFRHIMEHKSFTLFPEITWLRPLCRSCAQKELTGKTQQRAEPPHHMRSWRCFHVNLCKVS